jgi:cytochrome c oxidase subunit III
MSLISALTAKSWMQQSFEDLPAPGRLTIPTARLGLFFFLAVVTVLFSLLAVAWSMRMMSEDWRPLPEPPILWLNTLLLVLSSTALHRSWTAARRNNLTQTRAGLTAAAVLAVSFLAGQFVAWWQMSGLGYFLATNPANTFFYLLTALHALHIAGGMVALARTGAKLRDRIPLPTLRFSLELCTLYWHFLLMVWLGLFALMLSDNDHAWMHQGLHHMH